MRDRWNLFAVAFIFLVLTACASHPPRQSFEGIDLANSWEAQYLEAWGDSGV